MELAQLFAATIPSILTMIGGVWYLSAKLTSISAKVDATATEQTACDARHSKAIECTNANIDKLEYRFDKLGNRVTALEVKSK
jgi:hypothetical protein